MPAKRILKSRDRKFRLLFAEHPQPMWIVDAGSRRFLEVNAAACHLYGYSRAEFRKMNLADVQSGEDNGRFPAGLRGPGRPAASEWRHRTRSGLWIEVEMAMHPIPYGGQSAELAVLTDITGRRQLEDQLRQAQKMEALGLLTGGVAHDFNNLLTLITGYGHLILGKLGQNDPNRHSAEQIVKAAERAAELTGRLLLFSRRRAVQAKALDLNQVVTGLGALLQRLIGEKIELRLDLTAELGSVHADAGRMEQVLLNLAANSRDAMPQGGTLTIRTANLTVEPSPGAAAKPGSYVVLTVRDTGAGMDEATRAQAFEPIFTTKGAGLGTGLGLYTVSGIVKQSGGAVELSSQPGLGACFKVYLPRIDRPTPAAEPVAPIGAGTILLVDDDAVLRTLVRETMEGAGYGVLEASGAAEARGVAANRQGAIDLLISGAMLPEASGPELAKEFRSRWPGLKVLVLLSRNDGAIAKRGTRRKGVAFLSQPFTPEALAAKVRKVLENDGKTEHAGR